MSASNVVASVLNAVWAECVGTCQYTGRNFSGAEVHIDMGPDEFSSGELMKTALATCNIPPANHHLAKALSGNFKATVGCPTVKNNAEERYESFQVEVITNLSSLDAEQRELFSQRVAGTAGRHCIVNHTIEHGVSYTMAIVDPNGDRVLKRSDP